MRFALALCLLSSVALAQPTDTNIGRNVRATNRVSAPTGQFSYIDGGIFSSSAANNVCGFVNRTEGARVCFGPDSYCYESGTEIFCNTSLRAPQHTASANNAYGLTPSASSNGIFVGYGTNLTDPGAVCTNTTSAPDGFNSATAYDGDGFFHVACQNGVANRLAGVISVNTTAVGNVGASAPDDLQSYTLPANVLVHTGRCVRVTAKGTTANNANAKTVRLAVGAGPTALVTKQLTASIAGRWKIEALVCRTGASAQDYSAESVNFGGTTVSSTDGATVALLSGLGTLTETETATIVIKTQSTVSTSDNDIVSEFLMVELL